MAGPESFSVPVAGSRAREVDYTPINAGTLDGTTTVQQAIIPFGGKHSINFTTSTTGTPTATITAEQSDNYDSRRPTEARWAPMTDAGLVAYIAGAGKPAGSALTPVRVQVDPLRTKAIRWTATRTAGSGTYTLDVSML